jgi:putative ABC transport system ATP-binding protein
VSSDARELAVRCERLGKVYPAPGGGVVALADVDLDIARGEVLAVVGSSGSGKSTLLHLLGAIDRPTSGRALVLGEDVGGLGSSGRTRLRRELVGFVFQQFHLVPTLTAIENVELPLRYAGVARRERRASAAALLERTGLTPRADHLPHALSGGEQQRVAIARALANRPGLILADEPTGNLDHARADEVLGLLLEARRERGVAVVLVTHDAAVAARADRRVTLRDGRIVQEA